jgi:hypothetical protein
MNPDLRTGLICLVAKYLDKGIDAVKEKRVTILSR